MAACSGQAAGTKNTKGREEGREIGEKGREINNCGRGA
jgi:hypothetical protein